MTDGSHVGRPRSWIAVCVIIVGSIVGGIGLVLGPSWPLFWAGVAVAAVGGVLALAVGILSDVVVYTPVDITNGTGPPSAAAVHDADDGAAESSVKTEPAASVSDESARSGAENLPSG